MPPVEKYLKPEVINQIKRLDLRAQFVVRGFLQGLHASPFHGFSVEFSEHRKYTSGDDPKDIDWLVFAKTDKFYVKKYEAETNITGYLVMDLSRSMGYTYRQELSKFDYAICLAASLCYLMIHQQDPVGLITFDQRVRHSLPPRSKRTHLGNVLSHLTRLHPEGETDVSHSVILYHILDEAEVYFPFQGTVEFEEPETLERVQLDADHFRRDYVQEVEEFRETYRRECFQSGIDYIPLDTSMPFDKALLEYLLSRRARC